jgi:hypothetical protein
MNGSKKSIDETWWIDRAERTAELLRAIATHRPWTPNDMRQARECALELRTITMALTHLIDGRKPGWCPTMDAWLRVTNGCGLIVADLGYDIRQRSQHSQAHTAQTIRWCVARAETAARRHRKRLASGIPFAERTPRNEEKAAV